MVLLLAILLLILRVLEASLYTVANYLTIYAGIVSRIYLKASLTGNLIKPQIPQKLWFDGILLSLGLPKILWVNAMVCILYT